MIITIDTYLNTRPPIIVLGLGERISFLDGKSDGDFREKL